MKNDLTPVQTGRKAARPNQVTVASSPTSTHKGVQAPAVRPIHGSRPVEGRGTRTGPNANTKPGTGNLPVEQGSKTLTKKPVTGVAMSQRQNRQTGSSDTLRNPAADALRSSGQSKQSSVVTEVHKKVPTASALGKSLAASSRKPEQAGKTATGGAVPPYATAANNTVKASVSKATTDKKQISERKREAKRKNAKESTGPKSQRGKNNSRLNALRHGMTARQVLVLKGPSAENPERFNALRKRLLRAWSPAGERELMVFEEITICEWLLRRCLRCENGYIDRNGRIERQEDSEELQSLKALAGRGRDDELREVLQNADHLALPLGPGLDQILRYRQAILRQRDRAVAELERLQRIRTEGTAPIRAQL